jgi:hypothetical protein
MSAEQINEMISVAHRSNSFEAVLFWCRVQALKQMKEKNNE